MNVDEGGMNNDPCVYHVSFLLIVGDRVEGGGRGEGDRRKRNPAQLSTAKPRQEGKTESI